MEEENVVLETVCVQAKEKESDESCWPSRMWEHNWPVKLSG